MSESIVEIQTNLVGRKVTVRPEYDTFRDDLPDSSDILEIVGVFLDEDRNPCFLVHNESNGEIRNIYPELVHLVPDGDS